MDQNLQGWPKPSCGFPVKGSQLIHHLLMAFIRRLTVSLGIFQHDYACIMRIGASSNTGYPLSVMFRHNPRGMASLEGANIDVLAILAPYLSSLLGSLRYQHHNTYCLVPFTHIYRAGRLVGQHLHMLLQQLRRDYKIGVSNSLMAITKGKAFTGRVEIWIPKHISLLAIKDMVLITLVYGVRSKCVSHVCNNRVKNVCQIAAYSIDDI